MTKKLILGTRGSILALWQAEYIQQKLQKLYPHLEIELKIVKTKGDKILDVPLAKIGGKGLFTKELEELMLQEKIDIAVHSFKDVPVEMVDGLLIGAITQREDVRDAFLSEKYPSIESLPKNAIVGTTSLRRTMQLKHFRNDLNTQSLRGNVQTRLRRLKSGDFDAIILAMAGVNRLNLHTEISHILPLETSFMIPAMGQAALAVQCRDEKEIKEILHPLNHQTSVIETTCERAFVRMLNGGCQVPIGVNATLQQDNIQLNAIVGLGDGSEILQESQKNRIGNIEEAEILGQSLAEKFIAKGAKEILAKAEKMGFDGL
ncbi:hydroxymethylbilane synthase [Helicobacter monodelphidis]|uniref:hydroxymethylbilane synthase n=1 Tax=Helicobacter sp. 15-1451 TaxID=2004995 RepID=UPI000DCDA4D7|nr:hydroxymethylbilane synthase [Helicobacter sp. 15-1451]RAX57927.1 hydroxymethylbilane synthase [Helicobacter sp. 15-1451]